MKRSGPLLVLASLFTGLVLTLIFLVPRPETMPGETGYRFKPFKESLQARLLFTDEEKARFELGRASIRLSELEHEFAAYHGPAYEPLVHQYEESLLAAANESSLAAEVAERSAEFTPRIERMRDSVWDPPLRELFERARLNTAKTQRIALTFIAERDQAGAATRSLSSAKHHLDLSQGSVLGILAREEIKRYEGWLLFHLELGRELNTTAASTLLFDNATVSLLPAHLQQLGIMMRNAKHNQTRRDLIEVHNFTGAIALEMELRMPAPPEAAAENITLNETMPAPASEKPVVVRRIIPITLSNYYMDPKEVTVRFSETTILRFTAVDVEYSIYIPTYNIRRTVPYPSSIDIEFNATKRGTFLVNCAAGCIYRGTYGKIIVS